MKKAFLNIILIGYFTINTVITIKAQSFEKGGISIGGNTNIHFIDNKKYGEKYTNINIDIDFGYLITNKSFLGYRLNLYLYNEKTDQNYTKNNNWISSCYYKTLLLKRIDIEAFSGYGKYHFKHESKDGAHGLSNFHMAQFGIGVGFPQFLSAKIVLNPTICYDHTIMFVKNFEDYKSNQHFNNLVLKVGLYYYFNPGMNREPETDNLELQKRPGPLL